MTTPPFGPENQSTMQAQAVWLEHDGCLHCGGQRVLLYVKIDRRICETCNWDQGLGQYALERPGA